MKRALLLLVFVGCQKHLAEPPKDCDHVIPAAIDRMVAANKDHLPAEAIARAKRVAPKLGEAIARVCREDKWSAEVLDCHTLADSEADIDLCQHKLSDGQREHANKATQAVLDELDKTAGSAAPAK